MNNFIETLRKLTTHKNNTIRGYSHGLLARLQEITDHLENNK